MFSDAERRAMARALVLAARGPRGVNPQVGAVILSPDGDVLAEGWHRGAGTAHAEVDALSHLPAGAARGTTAVVTLEPCNHTGRTGPCAQALIDAGVARVVYALPDPGAVSGGGAGRLASAGVEVVSELLSVEAAQLIESWLEFVRLGRPRVTVKWAQSLDGRAAADDGTSQWITGPEARADVHRRRSEHDAIVVGTGTVLADDPSLTARHGGELYDRQPIPVVIGEREIPADARLHAHPRELIHARTHDLAAVLADLAERGVQSVFVEGGPSLASAFFAAGLVDDILVYTAPVLLGGSRLALGEIGVPSMPEAIRLLEPTITTLGSDQLLHARVTPLISDAPEARTLTEEPRMIDNSTTAASTTIRSAEATVPTVHGTFRFLAYHDAEAGTDHLAIVAGELGERALVRVHSECLTGEAFGSEKCECGPQLDAALDLINEHGGVVIYMRGQEGRGIGLLNKLRAYALQEQGLDTLDANLALGLPADARDYRAAAAILDDLGVREVRLLTNNTDKVHQLESLGVTVAEQVPLVVGVGPNNEGYLETKRARMGHIIDDALLHPQG